jgi:hypothetical protein
MISGHESERIRKETFVVCLEIIFRPLQLTSEKSDVNNVSEHKRSVL